MRKRLGTRMLAGAAALCLSGAAAAQPMPANPAAGRTDWWKRAVIYEVYPRSSPTATMTASATSGGSRSISAICARSASTRCG